MISEMENLEKICPTTKRKEKTDRSHIRVIAGTPEMYKCQVCEKVFRDKKGKCYHDACITGIRPYKCNTCERSFVKRSHFEYHERTHTGYKPFKCSLCEKAFPQRNKLNRHMRSHNREKEYRCDKCDKRYSKRDDLSNHASLVHTGIRPYVCKSCGKAFGLQNNLNRHARIHSNERPYGCDVCGKSFKDSSLLIRHKKIHGKERPFVCVHCTRSFLSKSELARHVAIHTDTKPFCCAYCNTIFRRKDNLDRHIRHHHNDDGNGHDDEKNERIEKECNEIGDKNKPVAKKKCQKSNLLKGENTRSVSKEEQVYQGVVSRGNSRDQINSRMDSLGNITPIIRGPGESSNAVPVINGPIAHATWTRTVEDKNERKKNKKTYTYTEPIPLAEAVVINRRIEEKLYPQTLGCSTNNYYFYRKTGPSVGVGIVGTSDPAGNLPVPVITSTSRVLDANEPTTDGTRSIANDNSILAETIDTHHWRRRTAESFKSSRSIAS